MKNYDTTKHLEMIENIIDRMNRNCFQIKFGVITIISALLALYADKDNITYIYICVIPFLCGFIMDCFYLKLEKCYRDLFDDVRNEIVNDYDLSIKKYKKNHSLLGLITSYSIIWMYLLLLILLIFLWA